jgi:hypothetical protein
MSVGIFDKYHIVGKENASRLGYKEIMEILK